MKFASFSITGPVIRGNQLGRKLGYPTANIQAADESKYHHLTGVYAARVDIGNAKHYGMANIGFRPTLSYSSFTIEINIFNFQDDIYGEIITIHFLERIRDELKFDTLDELVKQMKLDETEARSILLKLLQTDTDTR